MPIMVGIGSSRVPIGTRNSLRHNHYPLAFQTSSNKHQTSSTTSSTSSSMVAKDFTAAAVGFFGGVRIPASLVAGASIGQLFSLKKETMDISSKPVTERILIQMYNIFILASFLFSMCSIVVSTAANVSILYGGFNPLAETGYELLKREFPLEFIGTRFCFLTSLMSFLVAVTSRIIFEFRLYEKERRDGGLAVILSMATLVSCLLSYVNTTLYCWPNLPRMGIYIMKVCRKCGDSIGDIPPYS